MRKEWTPEEDARLIEIANDTSHKMSAEEIGNLFGRSESSVEHRAIRLGCTQLGRARTTAYGEEIIAEVLKLNAEGHTIKEISALMPTVGIGSIPQMLRRHGVKSNNPQEWTQTEVEWLKANYALLGGAACGRHLDKTGPSVCKKARKLGLQKGKRKATRRRLFDEPAICAAYKSGMSRMEVTTLFKTFPDNVSKILKKNGIPLRPQSSRFRDHQEAIIQDYQTGTIPTEDIGAKYGLSGDRIREGLRELGLYDPSRSGRFANRKSPYDCWVAKYGIEEADRRRASMCANQSISSSGENNPMYGKPTPQGAGNGWKGWYKEHYFRSLREVMFMIDMDAKGVAWIPGEKGNSIRYQFDGSERTYRPDFIVGTVMYELKPAKLHQTPNVAAKKAAAEAYCAVRGMEYRLTDWEINKGVIKAALDRGDIRFTGDYLARFNAYAS